MLSVVVDIITGVPYFPPTSPLHPVLGLEELKQNGKRTAEHPLLSWATVLASGRHPVQSGGARSVEQTWVF